MFAVTAGIGLELLVEKHKANHDDYSEIMAKALADRPQRTVHGHARNALNFFGMRRQVERNLRPKLGFDNGVSKHRAGFVWVQ